MINVLTVGASTSPPPPKSGASAGASHLCCGDSDAQYLRFASKSHSGAAQDRLGFGVSRRFWFSFSSYCSCPHGYERSGPVGSEYHVLVDYVHSRMQVCGGEQVVCIVAVLSACAPWVIALMSVAFRLCSTSVPDVHAGSPTFTGKGGRECSSSELRFLLWLHAYDQCSSCFLVMSFNHFYHTMDET